MAELAVRKKMTFADLRASSVLWDDDVDVQQTLRGAGFRVIDPVQYNQRNEAA